MYCCIATTLFVIISTTAAQTLIITSTSNIMDTTRLLPTTSFNGVNSTAVLPTRTHIVNGHSSSGFVYEPSTTVAVVMMETQSTVVPMMITDILSTNIKSSNVVVSNTTGNPDETNSSGSDINHGAIIGAIVGAIVLFALLMICFVIIMRNKSTRIYKFKIDQQPQIGNYA